MTSEQLFNSEGYFKCSVSPNEEPPTYCMSKDGTDSFISFDGRTETYHSFAVTESGDVRTVSVGFKLLYAILTQFDELRWV